MAAGTALYWSILFLGFVFVSADQKKITAESGQNATLPCRVPNNNKPIIVVEWSRADLGNEYVLFYRDKKFDPEHQHSSFVGRVDLQDKHMKDGNVSLILKDVTRNDSGRYECRVFRRGMIRRKRANLDTDPISIIYLSVVDPPGQPGGDTEDGSVGLIVGLSVFGLLGGAVVFFIYKKHKAVGLGFIPTFRSDGN